MDAQFHPDFAGFKHAPEISGRFNLAWDWDALWLDSLVVSDIGPLERVALHGADDVGGIDQCFGGELHQRTNGEHGLGAVDERNGFLGFKDEGA